MINSNLWQILLFIPILLISCSEDVDSEKIVVEAEPIDTFNLAEQLGLNEGEVKMFTMPTPVQMATALNILGTNYNEDILLKHHNTSVNSDIQLSLLLGMYLTDLGYTTIYNNTQKSINYAKDAQFIMEELPIPQYTNENFKNRFESNIENRDSLCKTILDGFNMAHQHIDESENKNLGLLILTGAYIESLYIVSSVKISNNWVTEYDNLFIQQKLFLDNFLALLSGYTSNQQIAAIYNKLTKLKLAFNNIEVSFNSETDSHELATPINEKTHNDIKTIITAIRNDVTN